MKTYLTLFLLLCSMNSYAALNKWVDKNGDVHYSDQPPPANVKAQTLRPIGSAVPAAKPSQSAASAPAAAKTVAEREAELKKAQQAKKEAADKAAQEQAQKEANKTNCAAAQQNLRTLQEGTRMVEIDANGERSYLDDAQRQQRTVKAQQDISAFCK